MEDGSNFDYYEDHTIVTGGGSNMLFLGAFGAILMIASRIPSLMFNIELMNNVVQSPTVTWALYLLLGSLIALVAGILIGLGFMALMKRYGKPYGPILFLAVVVPGLVSQFTSFQVTSPEEAYMAGTFLLIVGVITSIIVSVAIFTIQNQSVNPNLAAIAAILNIANPFIYMVSGVLLMIIENPPFRYTLYFLTGFGFFFMVNVLFIMLFYSEARTDVTRKLDW